MMTDLQIIPQLAIEESGLHFRYLVFTLSLEGEEKVLVRALDDRPYRGDLDQRIIDWTWQGLEESGMSESQAELRVGGGGSLVINPYQETATLFGQSPRFGAEEDRQAVAAIFQSELSSHEISWFDPGYFEEQERKEKEEKARAAAAARAAKKAKEAASTEKEEEAVSDSTPDESQDAANTES